MLSDIEIAENCKLKDIREIAATLGLSEDDLESVAGGVGHAFGEWYAGKRLL